MKIFSELIAPSSGYLLLLRFEKTMLTKHLLSTLSGPFCYIVYDRRKYSLICFYSILKSMFSQTEARLYVKSKSNKSFQFQRRPR